MLVALCRHRARPGGGDLTLKSPMSITYRAEPELSVDEFIDVLRRSTLAERRPVLDLPRIAQMLRNADVIVTARSESLLVGVSRAITDFVYCTYLSDLAVDAAFQKQGIGRGLIERTHAAAGLATRLILISAPKSRSYYSHIGMIPHDSCWMCEPDETSQPGAGITDGTTNEHE